MALAIMRSDLEVQYKLLESCILSGQVPSRQLTQMMRADPSFATWLRTRKAARNAPLTLTERLAASIPTRSDAPLTLTERLAASVPTRSEDIDLIPLAAWLWRLAKQAEASADTVADPEQVILTRQDAPWLGERPKSSKRLLTSSGASKPR